MTKKDWIQLDFRPAVSDTTAVTLVEAFIWKMIQFDDQQSGFLSDSRL